MALREAVICEKIFIFASVISVSFAQNRPKSDISGALGPIHCITLKAFARALGDVFAFSFNLAGTLYVAKKTIFKPDLHKNIERLPILNLV